jgi:phenylacetate-CoA ligase
LRIPRPLSAANWLGRWRRRQQLAALGRLSPARLAELGDKRALEAFRRAAARVPAYQDLLAEHGVAPGDIRAIGDLTRRCPVLTKETTFGRFSLHELCQPGALDQLAAVVTSSGQGGRLAFGLTTRAQARRGRRDIDLALEYAFGVDQRRTLLINCLPMGVRFSSDAVTIADVSVREDMALALASNFGPYYEQIIVVGDPLFLKRLCDAARDQGIDWSALRVNLVIGEEPFGENYRAYLAARLALDLESKTGGLIGSSMGVGELGLNLFPETRETIALRRRAGHDPALAELLFGAGVPGGTPPMLFAYNPLRVFVETLGTGADGFGKLTVTLADPGAPLPLVRYQSGDLARLIAPDRLAEIAERGGLGSAPRGAQGPALPLVAVAGREGDRLGDGRTVTDYKDALYSDHEVADSLSGAFRLEAGEEGRRVHVQLRQGAAEPADLSARLHRLLPGELEAEGLVIWPFEDFPFGMTLDYERKFDYLAAPAKV